MELITDQLYGVQVVHLLIYSGEECWFDDDAVMDPLPTWERSISATKTEDWVLQKNARDYENLGIPDAMRFPASLPRWVIKVEPAHRAQGEPSTEQAILMTRAIRDRITA